MKAPIFLAAALSALPAAATAAAGAATVYGGHRAGGGFTDSVTGQSIDVKGSGTLSISVDWPIDAGRQIQLFVSRQRSQFDVGTGTTANASSLDGRPMSVSYFHLGGTNFFGPVAEHGTYVVGGLGVTRFDPAFIGYSSAWRPSMNIGIGYQLPLGRRFALRIEARGFITLVNSEGGLFCSGGCVVSIRGDSFTQGEALIGMSARF